MRQPALFFGHGSPMSTLGGPGDEVSFFNDVVEGGSISMTGVRIG
ncbi:MAG: hypothetical protein Q8K90_06215 [Brevundimonas sp.]|nr:hypothetical protein [Brevundimonas sp.]